MSALQYARPIRKNLVAPGTMVLLTSSIPALGQVPGPRSDLPSAPSAKAESYSSQQSKTSLAGTDQTSSIESGRETLTEQADYFVPMTNSERWDHYAYSLVEPQAFLYPAVQAGLNQARNRPHEWGQGVEGYGRRFGSAYGQHLIGSTVSNAIAFRLHEDNRYFKSGKTGIGRLSYAITSTLLGAARWWISFHFVFCHRRRRSGRVHFACMAAAKRGLGRRWRSVVRVRDSCPRRSKCVA
jgi:hypothetical protein